MLEKFQGLVTELALASGVGLAVVAGASGGAWAKTGTGTGTVLGAPAIPTPVAKSSGGAKKPGAAAAKPTPPAAPSSKAPVAAATATPAQIQRWIRDLNLDQYHARRVAAESLLRAGDAAVPAMKKALNGLTTPEMRHLLRKDLSKIANADFLRGPLITLNAHNMSAQRAFTLICKQAGTSANVLQQGTNPQVTLRVKNAPFWQVMQQMAEQTNISPMMYYNQGAGMPLGINGVLNKGDFASFHGAFAVVAQNISYNRQLTFSQPKPPAATTFNMSLWLLAIPGKTGLVQPQQPVLRKAVDNRGNSLLLSAPNTPNMDQTWYGNQMPAVATNFSINLAWPKKAGTRIKEFKGYLPVQVCYHHRILNLKIKAKGTAHESFNGVRVATGNLGKVNGLWQFTVTVTVPTANGNMLDPSQQMIVNQVQNFNGFNSAGPIQTAAGTVLNPNGWQANGSYQQGYVYTIPVQAGGKPAKLTMPLYTRTRMVKVPFDLKNIPMP